MATANVKKNNVFKYAGPSSLKDVEARLLEIDAEKSARIWNAKENYTGSYDDEREADEIDYLEVGKPSFNSSASLFWTNVTVGRQKVFGMSLFRLPSL